MKNRNILYANQQAEIYRDHYRPSLNLWRFTRSILGVLIFGSTTCANNYSTTKKRLMK